MDIILPCLDVRESGTGLDQQFSVVMRVGRTATAQDVERGIADVFHAVRRARRNPYGIAGGNVECLASHGHPSFTLGDVIQLLSLKMPVQDGCPTRLDDGFGQTLAAVDGCSRVCQLPDFGPVLGLIGFNIDISGFHDST